MSTPITARHNRFDYTFSVLPKRAYQSTHNLSPAAKDIYLFIVDHINGKQRTGWTIPVSDVHIQQAFGYARETISRARAELQRCGLTIQLDHTQKYSRVFYVAPPQYIYWMHAAIIVTFIKALKKWQAHQAFGRLAKRQPSPKMASPVCDDSVTNLCPNNHKVVTVSSQQSVLQNPAKPCETGVSSKSHVSGKDISIDIHKDPPPISPSNIEKLSLAWNESHEYEEGEGVEFDKYFDKAIRATMAQHAVDENVATAALIRAFHRTKRNPAGHHPYDYPTAYTGDPDHSESNATPRGKKILRGAIHAVKSGESFSSHKQPSSESNDSMVEAPQIERQNPIHENMDSGDSEKGSAPPPKPNQAEPSRPDTPKTSLATVRRNLAGRAAMLKAGIISPLSRSEVLSHAQPGLDAFDDTPGDDVILGVWNELAPTPVEPEDTPPKPVEPIDQPKPDAFMELGEIQAKIAGLDEMRRSGTLSVDEIAKVTQEIAALKRQKVMLQRDADKCSASVAQDSDKGVYDAAGAIELSDEGSTGDSLGRRIARTIKSSLMASKEYSDEQIVLIVQRQDRSIDSAAILEVWHSWSDWSADLNGMVDQRIQSGVLMPDEVLEARSYAARLRDFQRKNEQWESVV